MKDTIYRVNGVSFTIDVQKAPIEKQQKLINWLQFVRIHTFGADTRYEQKLPAGVLLHVED